MTYLSEIITDWRDVSALSAFGLLYGIACAFLGYYIGHRKPSVATPGQRAISAKAGAAMRTERMHMSMTAREIAQERKPSTATVIEKLTV